MADQSDVMDALQAVCIASCFPSGPTLPSITGRQIGIGQGWPLAQDIDAAIAAGNTLVSIYAIPGTTGRVDTPFDWAPGAVAEPVHGISASVEDDVITLVGLPYAGEYVTAIIDGVDCTVSAQEGDTVGGLAASLAANLAPNNPRVTWTDSYGSAQVVVPFASSIVVRIGAQATVGQISHRQRQNFQITVWAPTPSDRTAVARAIDVALKANLEVLMPDTSIAIIRGQGSNLDDKRQETSGYHRALIFNVEWDTLDEYPAWEITIFTARPSIAVTAPATVS